MRPSAALSGLLLLVDLCVAVSFERKRKSEPEFKCYECVGCSRNRAVSSVTFCTSYESCYWFATAPVDVDTDLSPEVNVYSLGCTNDKVVKFCQYERRNRTSDCVFCSDDFCNRPPKRMRRPFDQPAIGRDRVDRSEKFGPSKNASRMNRARFGNGNGNGNGNGTAEAADRASHPRYGRSGTVPAVLLVTLLCTLCQID